MVETTNHHMKDKAIERPKDVQHARTKEGRELVPLMV
jgi:hypothetical protein